MTKDRSAFKAGLFIVASAVLCLVVIISIKGLDNLFDPKVSHRVSFKLTDDLAGLRIGDTVRVGGFPVGEVRDIEASNVGSSTDGEPKLVITFDIPRRYVLREDARMGMQSTLTGTAWLNIEALGAAKVASAEHVFEGRPNPISAIFASMGEVMPDIKAVATDIRTQTLPKLNESIAGLSEVVNVFRTRAEPLSDRAVDMLTQIRDFFGDSKGDWRNTIQNLKEMMAEARAKVPAILDKADASVAKAQDALVDLKEVAANTRQVTADARDLVQRNKTRIDSMIEGLKTSSDNIKGATAEIRRAPWRILYKPGKDEMNNLTLFDATRQFAEGANDLNDATSALRDAMQNPNLDPEVSKKLMEELERSFNKFKEVEKKLWQEAK